MKYSFLNGKMVDDAHAKISVHDIALGRGYGIFDYFQVKDRKPIHMKYHLDRLERSIGAMRLNIHVDREEINHAVDSLLDANGVDSAGIKLIATGGVSPDGASIGEGSLAILVYPYFRAPDEVVEKGVKLLSYEHQRLLPHIKSINYLYAIYLSDQLKAAGAIEPLYYTQQSVRETARANVMAVVKGKIITCADQILEGITRKTIIEECGFPIELRDITLEEMLNADEVFLCGTTKVALGVTQIDDRKIGNGKVGDVTMAVRQKLIELE
jgi:D-alanine transaminase/branched-chain amino acid aminotransferase